MKRYAWLGAAVLLAAAIGLWFSFDDTRPAPAVDRDMPAMPMLARDPRRADRIQIVRGDTRLELERRGQLWCLAQNGGYPVKPELGQHLLDQLLALQLGHPTAPVNPESRRDDPKDPQAGLIGIRVLALNGAGLGALIIAEHPPDATTFPAHPFGDPRDWQAMGALDVKADPMAWVDPHILALDPARVTGAVIDRGTESFTLDAEDAAGRLKMLEGLAFTDIHQAAQMPAAQTGRLSFAQQGGMALIVDFHLYADQLWLSFHATAPGMIDLPPGDWLFRYPSAAGALLQPAS